MRTKLCFFRWEFKRSALKKQMAVSWEIPGKQELAMFQLLTFPHQMSTDHIEAPVSGVYETYRSGTSPKSINLWSYIWIVNVCFAIHSQNDPDMQSRYYMHDTLDLTIEISRITRRACDHFRPRRVPEYMILYLCIPLSCLTLSLDFGVLTRIVFSRLI